MKIYNNPVTAYELARLRLQAFAMLDGWGTINEKGEHVKWTVERRQERANEFVEWALTSPSEDKLL